MRARYVRVQIAAATYGTPPMLEEITAPTASILGKLRDELTDAVNYLVVRLFPVPGFPVLGIGDPARFAYVIHRPYTRASRKADEVLTFVVHSLIHADDDAAPG